MKYTQQELRAAFYKAAANIEARPDLYDFDARLVGDEDCPACMWGHVGRVLALHADTCNIETARACGFVDLCPEGTETGWLYYFKGPAGNSNYAKSAKKLRAFADHHWPESESLPDWNAIAAAGSVVKEDAEQ